MFGERICHASIVFAASVRTRAVHTWLVTWQHLSSPHDGCVYFVTTLDATRLGWAHLRYFGHTSSSFQTSSVAASLAPLSCCRCSAYPSEGPWGTTEKVLDSNHPFLVSIRKLAGTVKQVHVFTPPWRSVSRGSVGYTQLQNIALGTQLPTLVLITIKRLGQNHSLSDIRTLQEYVLDAVSQASFRLGKMFVACKSLQHFNSYFGVSSSRMGSWDMIDCQERQFACQCVPGKTLASPPLWHAATGRRGAALFWTLSFEVHIMLRGVACRRKTASR